MSLLQKERLDYIPKLPAIFSSKNITCVTGEKVPYVTTSDETVKKYFPHSCFKEYLEFIPSLTAEDGKVNEGKDEYVQRVGVLFSGGPAAGGHNVVWGLFDYLKKLNKNNELVGFLMGPKGLMKNKYILITEKLLDSVKNQGGFALLGTGRDKIKTKENYSDCLKTALEHRLTGLVIIGGDDSNTNSVQLAEYFIDNHCPCDVIGTPKTIDGDLRGNGLEVSFGHDTCCKVYAELVGNLMSDNSSTKKYYSFVRLMGRDASHITLEVALMTHPNWCFISEEVGAKKQGIKELTNQLLDVVLKRAEKGKNYGVFLIPEGVVGFIPEMQILISELNNKKPDQLTGQAKETYEFLPEEIQEEMTLKRDDHGNIQLSHIEIERLFSELVAQELKKMKAVGKYNMEFQALKHFYGYEGRCAFPSNFDCDYCFSLGYTAALLLQNKKSGYMACVRNLAKPTESWEVFGLPIASMVWEEHRNGKDDIVIRKALVDLEGKPFKHLKDNLSNWMVDDSYIYPGPMQFSGLSSQSRTITLHLESNHQP